MPADRSLAACMGHDGKGWWRRAVARGGGEGDETRDREGVRARNGGGPGRRGNRDSGVTGMAGRPGRVGGDMDGVGARRGGERGVPDVGAQMREDAGVGSSVSVPPPSCGETPLGAWTPRVRGGLSTVCFRQDSGRAPPASPISRPRGLSLRRPCPSPRHRSSTSRPRQRAAPRSPTPRTLPAAVGTGRLKPL